MLHEMLAKQQVFRRITGQCQLGKHHHVGRVLIACRIAGLHDLARIGGDGADQEVELRHDDAEALGFLLC